ncbi:LIM domain and RING finger protein [Wickerhamomyces ciferrii]|uniref:LIM domain and RING finger protein n=1 Tax=Wickerhamomyces ciferrii (strain ATCC 14091 / BCRC 22168 / CBS 111 / JCM 3599 / NBRC 0793 / NRRL Y-1031 F-60-10) TaxID=1206466 RepID=K0KJL4_WICCF|nr:LIM domain and RING finger protein [Wickerhamomyces ciferrii]CCH41268.1 LIM domain and RING finger protein [Wickerhamomyces ciferrii]
MSSSTSAPPTKSRRQFNKPRRPENQQNKNQKNGSWKRTFARDGPKADEDEDLDETEQCVICANKIEVAAKSGCNHVTCHVCTFRQRALYDKKSCLVCRTENSKLIFTENVSKQFNEFSNGDFVKFDEKFGIEFTSQFAADLTLGLLQNKCLLCDEIFQNFNQLEEHVKDDHERFFCTICSTNKKAFPTEFKIYSAKQLQNHQTRGDEKGFDGHPACRFCKGKRFYSEDELLIHMRERHERCHVCDQLDSSNPQYFKNYPALEDHFRSDHYICNVQACLDKKFVVFGDEFELQAHMISEHGGVFGTNMVVGANFRETNNNRYHSQLSTFRPVNNNRNNNNNQSNNNNRNNNGGSSQDQNDSIETKRMRLEERARHYLNYSTNEFKEFQDLNQLFKNHELSSSQLLLSYQALFKSNPENDVYLLLFELSELYPQKSPERLELSKIVKDHENRNKDIMDFPALPGSSNSLNVFGASWGAGGSGSRSNSNSNLSKTKKKASLDDQFPALPSSSSVPTYTPAQTNVRYRTVLKPKTKTQVTINSTPSNYVPNYLAPKPKTSTPPTSRATQKPKLNDSQFPALPSAAPKKVIPRVNPVPAGNGAWDVGSSSNPSSSASSSLNLNELGNALPTNNGNGGKKNKKKKQILFSMGGN